MSIKIEVENEVTRLRKKYEEKYGPKVSAEVIIKYEQWQEFHIDNKDLIDQKKYPLDFKGYQIERPYSDLKEIIFKFNGVVFVRFHHKIAGGYCGYTDEVIGKIQDEKFIYNT